jgi:WD40 repeat protein
VAEDDSVDSFLRRLAHMSAIPILSEVSVDPAEREKIRQFLAEAQPVREGAELPPVEPTRYRLIGELARGGMGRILVAYDQRLERPVALKQLLAADDEGDQTRFVREALVTAQLQHPSIVPVHDAGRWPGGEPFYAMKLVSGRPLDEVLRDKHTLADRLAMLPVILAVAEAVAYAHSRGVIHRDLKPSNVMVGEFGETLVVDWGLAKLLRGERGKTLSGAVIGTPGFMSPEQARSEPADERTDVYALGAMLYWLLAGRPPYDGLGRDALLSQVLAGPPPPLASRSSGAPDELLAIVERAMARDPEARYASARELSADLRRFQTGQLVAAYRYSLGALIRRWLRRHRLAVAAVAAVVAVAAILGAASVYRIERERRRAVEAQAREARRVDELILAQAAGTIERDQTSALAWLKELSPAALKPEAAVIAADAYSRGLVSRIFSGHHGLIHALAFSPDGKWLATGGADRTVRMWSLDGDSHYTLGTAASEIRRLGFSADGLRLVVVAAEPQTWDLKTRQAQPLARDLIDDAAFSADGRMVATAGRDGFARVWEIASGRLAGAFAGPGPIERVAVSGDGGMVALRSGSEVRLFVAGKAVALTGAQQAPRGELLLSADGRWLAAAQGGELRLWALPDGAVRSLAVDGTTVQIAFSRDGSRLAAACRDGTVQMWRLPGGELTTLMHRHATTADLAFSPDGTHMAVARLDQLRLINLVNDDQRKLRAGDLDFNRVRFSPDGRLVAGAGLDGTVRVWPIGAWEMQAYTVEALRGHAGASALSVETRRLAVATGGKVLLWEPGGTRPLAVAVEPRRLAFSADGTQLAGGGPDGTLRLWQLPGGEARDLGHGAAVTGIAFSPRGDRIVSTGEDGSLVVADPTRGTTQALGAATAAAVFAGAEVAAVGRDGQLRLFSGGAPRPLGHALPAGEPLLSAAGDVIAATVRGGHTVLLCHLDGRCRDFYSEDELERCSLLGGGTLLVTANPDGVVHMRDPDSGQLWQVTRGLAQVQVLAANREGLGVAIAAGDGSVRFWPSPVPADPIALHEWLRSVTSATIGPDNRLR